MLYALLSFMEVQQIFVPCILRGPWFIDTWYMVCDIPRQNDLCVVLTVILFVVNAMVPMVPLPRLCWSYLLKHFIYWVSFLSHIWLYLSRREILIQSMKPFFFITVTIMQLLTMIISIILSSLIFLRPQLLSIPFFLESLKKMWIKAYNTFWHSLMLQVDNVLNQIISDSWIRIRSLTQIGIGFQLLLMFLVILFRIFRPYLQ